MTPFPTLRVTRIRPRETGIDAIPAHAWRCPDQGGREGDSSHLAADVRGVAVPGYGARAPSASDRVTGDAVPECERAKRGALRAPTPVQAWGVARPTGRA